MNTLFIGIAGGTGSGKTTLTEHLAKRFGPDISVVHHDNYYKRQNCSFEERCLQNYDHPDAFDTDLMIEDLKKLKAGQTIHCPVYDYGIHNRTDKTVEVRPTKVVIIEGILIFQNPDLRDLLDIKIFVETDADVRILRRALRDVEERARLPAKLGAAVCLLLCAWFLAPLGMGIVHIGMLWPSALLVLAAARLLRPDVFRRLLRKKWLRWTVRAALGLGLAAALGIFGWMVSAAANRAAPAESTVIVLGCQVRGTEPSLTLQRRVDAAADYLRAHPQARCVASGGQSDDEEISEAECIRAALIAAGIDPARIEPEDQSTSTEENLRFSAERIRAAGLSTNVVIASDNFHQLRAALWARHCGLTPYAAGCRTAWFLAPGYWAREIAGVAYTLLT